MLELLVALLAIVLTVPGQLKSLVVFSVLPITIVVLVVPLVFLAVKPFILWPLFLIPPLISRPILVLPLILDLLRHLLMKLLLKLVREEEFFELSDLLIKLTQIKVHYIVFILPGHAPVMFSMAILLSSTMSLLLSMGESNHSNSLLKYDRLD